VAAQKNRMPAAFFRNGFQFMDGAFSFNCGDSLFIISKAPPGAKSDKKLMKFLVYLKYSAHPPRRTAARTCKPVENNYSRRMAKKAAAQNGRADLPVSLDARQRVCDWHASHLRQSHARPYFGGE